MQRMPKYNEWHELAGIFLSAETHLRFINFPDMGERGAMNRHRAERVGLGRFPGVLNSRQAKLVH